MANILDYIAWRGDLSFRFSPLNPVDNIIFSQLSYLPFTGIIPGPKDGEGISMGQAAEIFAVRLRDNALQGDVLFKDDAALIEALGKSHRFKDCELHSFVNYVDAEQEKQFSALCINIGVYTFVAYRGTDISLVGWKEDLNMCFSDTVPAQLEATAYLEEVAARKRGMMYLGGHSKGGNLAVYAASSCNRKIRRRVIRIYNNDAPGFHRNLIASEGFRKIRSRIYSFIPQFSVVGMLFHQGCDYQVVKSSSTGLLQHDLYSWEVIRNNLVLLDKISRESDFINKTIKEWLGGVDYEKRQQFIDALYTILSAAQVENITELGADWLKTVSRMIQSMGNVDDSTKALIYQTIGALLDAARRNIDTLLPPKESLLKRIFRRFPRR